MNEIEKMMQNVVGEVCTHTIINPAKCNHRRMTRCCGCDWLGCPPFTAEKQLKILCFIVNNKHSVTFHDQVFGGDKLTLEKIQEDLAWAVNRIWQDLTEEEKKQVKGVLE